MSDGRLWFEADPEDFRVAVRILEHYALYIRSVPISEIEEHPYLPSVEQAAQVIQAEITKATSPHRKTEEKT